MTTSAFAAASIAGGSTSSTTWPPVLECLGGLANTVLHLLRGSLPGWVEREGDRVGLAGSGP